MDICLVSDSQVSAHDIKRFDDILETLPRKWTVGLCISERQLHKSKVSALQERDCERRQREVCVRPGAGWSAPGAGRWASAASRVSRAYTR